MFHKEPPRVAQLAALIAQHTGTTPYLAASIADELTRLQRQLRAVYTRACNGYQDWHGNWDQAAAGRDERRQERLKAKAAALVKELNGRVGHLEVQRDPRGPALRIWFSDHATYNSPESAFAIY